MFFRGREGFGSEWSWECGPGMEEPVRRIAGLIWVEILFNVVLLNYREV